MILIITHHDALARAQVVTRIIRTRDFYNPGDKIPKTLATEAGQLLVSTGPGSWSALPSPTATGQLLAGKLSEPRKLKWSAVGGRTTVELINSDATAHEVGDVCMWDTSGSGLKVKRCAVQAERRVCAVAAETIQPGYTGNYRIAGPCQVKVTGSGKKFQALRTSTTSGRAEACGALKCNGFVGWAMEDWTVNSLIDAVIDPENYQGI